MSIPYFNLERGPPLMTRIGANFF